VGVMTTVEGAVAEATIVTVTAVIPVEVRH